MVEDKLNAQDLIKYDICYFDNMKYSNVLAKFI